MALLFVVCCCCQQKKSHLEHLSYCRQDYVCRGFWQVVRTYSGNKKEERSKCRPSLTQKCCVGISFVSARQGQVGQKCRHLAVGPTCRGHVGNIASQDVFESYLFYSILFCSILFYSILFYFRMILYSIPETRRDTRKYFRY